ncbi:hypothetical protein NEOKW01_0018 [Nematocida sp. AWRm80]|nr:hypothetical protein NEOKW01_0018 [Nematocida sp. AWRm80]
MKCTIYICITITVIYIQLYRQSSRVEEIKGTKRKQNNNFNQSINIETDKHIQERTIDSTNRYIQSNEANWQEGSIDGKYMYYRYMQPMQYNQYGYSVQSACPIEQDNIYNPYYSTNTSYNRNISRKRTKAEQNTSTLYNPNTNNSMNTALDLRVPYNSRRAERSNMDIAIAGTSSDSDITRICNGTNALIDIEKIKKCIHIEKKYIVIDLYIMYIIKNKGFSALRKELGDCDGYKLYIEYNILTRNSKCTPARLQNIKELLNEFNTVIVWSSSDCSRHTTKQTQDSNRIFTQVQQFTERTDRYMNSKDNTGKKRIVLYNLSMRCIYNLASQIKTRDIISCYFTKRSDKTTKIRELLSGMQPIHALDIVASRQKARSTLISFSPNDNNESQSNTVTAINANSYTENIDVDIDSINSNKITNIPTNTDQDKATQLPNITYLSLIDRVHKMHGIGSIKYITDKVTERLDLSYLLWTQLIRENSLLPVLVHTLVIYIPICIENQADIQKAHTDIQTICNKALGIKEKKKKENEETEHIENENTDVATNTNNQLDTNVSGAECIKWIITAYKIYAHAIFPNLKTIVIYTYESDGKDIEANIEEWFYLHEQKDNQKLLQIEAQQNKQTLSQEKQNNAQESIPQIGLQLKIQIYFVPDSIRPASSEIFASAYIYDNRNSPNLAYLFCYTYSNKEVTTNSPEETSTKTSLAPVQHQQKQPHGILYRLLQ